MQQPQSPVLEGFRADYQRLLQLFLARSLVSGPEADSAASLPPTPASTSTDLAPEALAATASTTTAAKVYNFTFCTFTECWHQLHFFAIFCGHRNVNSQREFFDHAIGHVLERLSSRLPIEERIFAFYLLYSLWYLHLNSYKMPLKIRIDRQTFVQLQDLVGYSSRQQQFDIVLAYRKLFLAGAFALVEATEFYGPYYKSYLARRPMPPNPQDTDSDDQLLAQLKATRQSYCETLQMLQEADVDGIHAVIPNGDTTRSLMANFEENCF